MQKERKRKTVFTQINGASFPSATCYILHIYNMKYSELSIIRSSIFSTRFLLYRGSGAVGIGGTAGANLGRHHVVRPGFTLEEFPVHLRAT